MKNKTIYKKNQQSTSSRRGKIIFIIAALVVCGGLAAGLLAYHHHQTDKASRTSANVPTAINDINYGPPTDQEQKAGDEQKTVNESKDGTTQPTTQPDTATLTIVDASQYGDSVEVSSYVNNVVQSDGTCTFTFTQGATTVTRTAKAEPNASTTVCPTTDIARSAFTTAGDWNLTISYKSSASAGSKTTTVNLK